MLLIFGGHLEILIGGRLHDVCSSFVFIVIITRIGIDVVDDDVVLGAFFLGFFFLFYWCWSSHEYSDLLD